jgi:hypothetical protein
MHEEWIYLWLGLFDKEAYETINVPDLEQVRAKIFPQTTYSFAAAKPTEKHGPLMWSMHDRTLQIAIDNEIAGLEFLQQDESVKVKYADLLQQAASPWSIFPKFLNEYIETQGFLLPEQRAFVGYALGDYVFKQIRSGHIANLNMINDAYLTLGINFFEINPINAKRIRELQENLDNDFVDLLDSVERGGYFSQDIRRYYMPKPGSHLKFDESQFYPLKMDPQEYEKEDVQRGLMNITIDCLQDQLRGETITEDTVREVYEYVQIIKLMNGTHGYIHSCDENTSAFLTSWLELNMGKNLDFLRFRFSSSPVYGTKYSSKMRDNDQLAAQKQYHLK